MPEGRSDVSASDIYLYFTIREFLQELWRTPASQRHMASRCEAGKVDWLG
jgi:hypothetical protein